MNLPRGRAHLPFAHDMPCLRRAADPEREIARDPQPSGVRAAPPRRPPAPPGAPPGSGLPSDEHSPLHGLEGCLNDVAVACTALETITELQADCPCIASDLRPMIEQARASLIQQLGLMRDEDMSVSLTSAAALQREMLKLMRDGIRFRRKDAPPPRRPFAAPAEAGVHYHYCFQAKASDAELAAMSPRSFLWELYDDLIATCSDEGHYVSADEFDAQIYRKVLTVLRASYAAGDPLAAPPGLE